MHPASRHSNNVASAFPEDGPLCPSPAFSLIDTFLMRSTAFTNLSFSKRAAVMEAIDTTWFTPSIHFRARRQVWVFDLGWKATTPGGQDCGTRISCRCRRRRFGFRALRHSLTLSCHLEPTGAPERRHHYTKRFHLPEPGLVQATSSAPRLCLFEAAKQQGLSGLRSVEKERRFE